MPPQGRPAPVKVQVYLDHVATLVQRAAAEPRGV